MLKTAITGNIGSGKTTICHIFESLGVPLFYADTEAKNLYSDAGVMEAVKKAFEEDIFDANKELNKKKLAAIVFGDSTSLKILNKIIHPRLMEKYRTWLKKNATCPYSIHEAAVIFENHLENYFDIIINVSAPEDVRFQRIKNRDGFSDMEIKNRMRRQWPDEKKNKLADFVIVNDGRRFLIPQVMEIHNKLTQKKI